MAGVSFIDKQIGKLLKRLEKKGISGNTVIVLWRNHGYHLGDHTERCKHSNFQQETRIHIIVIGPGEPEAIKVDGPVELLDLFPTIFDIAGIPIPEQAEGKNH